MNIRLTNFGWGFHHDLSLQQGLVLHLTQLWKLSSCDLCFSLKLFLSCLHFSTHFYKKKKWNTKVKITSPLMWGEKPKMFVKLTCCLTKSITVLSPATNTVSKWRRRLGLSSASTELLKMQIGVNVHWTLKNILTLGSRKRLKGIRYWRAGIRKLRKVA